MSMGYGAAFTHEVELDDLKTVVGEELVNKFCEARDAMEAGDELEYHNEGSWEDYDCIIDDTVPTVLAFDTVVKEIASKFEEVTGISLHLGYHDAEDNGSCYDEVDGWYWEMDFSELFEPTEKFKKLQEKCGDSIGSRKFYTMFG